MPSCSAPVRDMMFLLEDVFDAPAIFARLPAHAETDLGMIESILEEAGRFCAERLQPLNGSGDVEGCRIENGVVRTPRGFREAYAAFRDGGWSGLSAEPEFGGQGLPRTVQILVDEMLSAANLSFGLFPGLTRGACEARRPGRGAGLAGRLHAPAGRGRPVVARRAQCRRRRLSAPVRASLFRVGLAAHDLGGAAAPRRDDGTDHGRRIVATARFFAERVLPQARGLAAQIGAGAGAIMAPDADWF